MKNSRLYFIHSMNCLQIQKYNTILDKREMNLPPVREVPQEQTITFGFTLLNALALGAKIHTVQFER